MARWHRVGLGLAFAVGAALRAGADGVLIPISSRTPAELGAAWSAANAAPRGELGTCVEAEGTERGAGDPPSYSLVSLSRVGGRLVLGVYVTAPVATEMLQGARLTDAARRMASSEPDQFRALCGDGFIGAVTQGANYVAELEVDPRDAARASDRLAALHGLGTTPDRDHFREALESVTTQFRVVARELPAGSHAAATPVVPAALVRRALAFPATVNEQTAQPYLGAFVAYPKDAASGAKMEVASAVPRDGEAEQVFLWDRRGAGVGSASRAAELRKAQSHSEPSPTALVASEATRPAEISPQGAEGAAQRGEAERSSSGFATAQQLPLVASAATRPPEMAEPSSSGLAVPQQGLRSRAALVFPTPTGVEVYATTEAPPGVYSEQVGHRRYWVPGAADGTAAVKDAIHSASAGSAPARGTTVLCAVSGVVLTDAPPVAGVHTEPAGSLHAWIAGVATPTPAQQQALAAAARAGAAR